MDFAILMNVLITLALTAGWFSPVRQTMITWSSPERIPGYADDTSPPILIADGNRTVHAFSSQWVGEDNPKLAVIYNQWSLDAGWTIPIDILLSPLKDEARLLDVFLDNRGVFHLVFFGGDNTQANIYYTQALATRADHASAWRTPTLISTQALNPQSGAILGDELGNLVVIFSGFRSSNGLYSLHSRDYGETWSEPTPVHLTNDAQLWPFDSKLFRSPSGEYHAIWSVYDIAGHGVSVLYAQFNIDEQNWSKPIVLASAKSGLGVSLSNGIALKDNLVAVYYNGNTNAFWMRTSLNDGLTWSEPIRIGQRHIGRNGSVSLVTDSLEQLHIFFGERITGNPDIHGMWHSILQKDGWTEPEPVVSGPQINDFEGERAFDPYEARAVVSQGNTILVTWRSDPGNKGNGVWYSHQTLEIPEFPLQELPEGSQESIQDTPQVIATLTPDPSSLFSAVSQTKGEINDDFPVGEINANNPGQALVVGILPAIILIAGIALILRLSR